MRCTVGPEGAPRRPEIAEACIVRDRILNDERFETVGTSHRHAKTHRTTVILHEEAVARKGQSLGEACHHFRKMVESIRKRGWRRRCAVAEAGIVRRDQMIPL